MDEKKTLHLDQKAFCCAICLSLPQDPVTIECGHSYCRSCVTLHWDRQQRQSAASYSCPMCQKEFTQRPALVRSTMLAFLLDELQKPPPPAPAEKSLTEKFTEQQDLINQIQSKESTLYLLSLKQSEIEMSAREAVSDLRAHYSSVTKLLQGRYMNLESRITKQCDQHTAHIKQLQIPLHAELSQLKTTLNRLDPQAVVPKHQETPEPSGKWSLFDEAKKAALDLFDQLKTSFNNGMVTVNAKLSQNGSVLQTISAEPRSRAELLGYTRGPISMDSTSAHSFLVLSEDRKTVTFTGVNQQYPENPNRFTEHWQVMNLNGRTGQWYFEVEWQITGQLRVAIVDTNLPRKDPVKSLFGNSERCWALHCDKSRFSFWSEGREQSLAGVMMNKVGVYVNTDSGVLCFYSVSPSTGAVLLHRVQAGFRGPVHIGLGFYLCSAGDTASFCPLP